MYKKILHIIHTPRFSGAEILVRDLCLTHNYKGIRSAVASFVPTEDDFLVSQNKLMESGVQFFTPKNKLKGLARAVFYGEAIRAFQPDIVYAHSILPAMYGRVARLFFSWKTPIVPVLHDASNDDYQNLVFHISELLLTHLAQTIFTVSSEAAANYTRRIPFSSPLRVVPNGIVLSAIKKALPKRASLRSELGLQMDDKLILQVGRLSQIKQQSQTLEAAAPLLQKDRRLKLWFAGLAESASIEQELIKRIRELGLKDQVKILGGRDDITDLLAAADIFAMPSSREAHSIALLEALASGVAVVASNILPFRYAAQWEGIKLIAVDDTDAYMRSIQEFMVDSKRYYRDLSAYSIEHTAAIYGGYVYC